MLNSQCRFGKAGLCPVSDAGPTNRLTTSTSSTGAEEDDDAEGSRLPLLIVIALFVLAAFGGVVWLAYTQGVARGRNDSPHTIVAQPGPAKVAAEQGENADAGQGP